MVFCLEQGADLHMAQLMPLPLTVSRSSKIQIGFTFQVPAYPGCPGKEAVKWLLLVVVVKIAAGSQLASSSCVVACHFHVALRKPSVCF